MISLANIIMMFPSQGQGSESPGGITSFLPLILIVVVFYFFMIRPQVKRQKDLKNFRESLKKGDKVITTGGIYGKIASISDNVITVDVGNGVNIKVDKNAVLKDSSDLQSQQQK